MISGYVFFLGIEIEIVIKRTHYLVLGMTCYIEVSGYTALIVHLDGIHISCFGAAVHVLLKFVDVEVVGDIEGFHLYAKTHLLGDVGIVVKTRCGYGTVKGIVRLHTCEVETNLLPIGKAGSLIPRNPDELKTVGMNEVACI